MEFVNIWMLLGLLAVSIPVIIHLLNRKSGRTVEWGAWRFLLTSLMQRRRRVLLEEMLLMACRCLVIAVLALALARPFIQPTSRVPWVVVMPMILLAIAAFGVSFSMWRYPKWRRRLVLASIVLGGLSAAAILFERHLNLNRLGRGAARDVVIILDGSSSMTLLQGAESNFEIARKEASELVKGAPRGTAFGLILGGPIPRNLTPAPLSNKREIFAALDTARPAQGTMRTLNCLTAAAEMLLQGSNPAKQIVIIGDGQAAGWEADATERWKVMKRVFGQLSPPPPVIWRTLPLPSSVRNMAVASVAPSREVIGTDREVGFRVTVLNAGTEAVTPREVRLAVEDKTLVNHTVGQLEPGASQTITFRHRFTTHGAQTATATVVADDDLPADDSSAVVVNVVHSLKVLLVDGNPDAPRFERASTYLSLALRPELQRPGAAPAVPEGVPGGTKAGREFLVATETTTAAELASRGGMADCSVVVLADVPFLPDRVAERIAEFVAAGGGLLVAPGARARPDFYNAWARQGETILPMPLGELAAAPSPTNAPALAPETFTGELLRPLRLGSDRSHAGADRRWLLDENSAAGAATVEGRFNDGKPAFATRALGRGRVVLSALPFDASLSPLPSRSHFVPLVHEIAYYLANPVTAGLNLAPCDGASILLSAAGQSSGDGHGLRGTYYRRKGFQGRSIQRIDPFIDFDWGGGPPLRQIPNDNFSVRWTGSLTPPETGTYEFSLRVDDRATLTIGDTVIGSSDYTPQSKHIGSARLVGGKPVAIRIDYEEDGGDARLRLDWKSDKIPLSPIPADVLLPDPPDEGAETDDPVRKTTGTSIAVEVLAPGGIPFGAAIVATELGPTLSIDQPLTPGVYRVRPPAPTPPAIAPLVGPDGSIPLSVRGDTDESDLSAMPQSGQEAIRDAIDLVSATKPEDLAKAIEGQSFGSEIWRMLAFATLFLLVGEIFLTRWIAIQRKTGEQEVVDLKEDAPTQTDSFREQLAKFKK